MTRRAFVTLPLAAVGIPDRLWCQYRDGWCLRFGSNVGSFFVHQIGTIADGGWWNVTHRRTGLSAGFHFSSEQHATRFVDRIEPLYDWGSIQSKISKDHPLQESRTILQSIADEIEPEDW